jgi:undecaprenyl-diphosphatase
MQMVGRTGDQALGRGGRAGRAGDQRDQGGMRALPPTGRTGVVVLVVAGAASLALFGAVAWAYDEGGVVADLDLYVSTWVAAHMPGWAEWLARPFSWIGGAALLPVVCIVAVVVLLWARRAGDALLLAVVTVVVNVLVAITKAGYDRLRPGAGSAIALPGSPSFPSGHAATGAAVFGLLGLITAAALETRRARIAAVVGGFAVGAGIGASRVVLNVHYVSDVVAGYAYGLAVLAVALLVAASIGRHRRTRGSGHSEPA